MTTKASSSNMQDDRSAGDMDQGSSWQGGTKFRSKPSSGELEEADVSESSSDYEFRSTTFDKQDMKRMGKTQELIRNFRTISSIALTSCVMGTWELVIFVGTPGLIAGGLSGLFWSMVWGAVGQFFVVLSLAEMASIMPTAGGQYHWVSELSPAKYQKFLSYTAGWFSALGWQAFTATDNFVVGSLIQSLISLNNPNYVAKNWQTTLLIIALAIGGAVFNICFARHLARIENIFAILHFGAYIPLIVVLLVMTKSYLPAEEVFANFTDNGAGWPSISLTVLVGQVSAMFTLLGSDSIAHMAEEVGDAGLNVPKSMIWSFVINIPLALGVLVTFLFCIGDLQKALDSGSPLIYVFHRATGSTAGATGLTIVLLVLLEIITASTFATTSRQTFAFSRDNGLPFSTWLARVSPTFRVPINSIIATALITCLLSLIYIGSAVAFNAVLSLGVVAVMATYITSIGCMIHRRLSGEPLPPARWDLGKAGLPINIIGLTYAVYSFFWSFWPNGYKPDAKSFNWACVLFMGVMIIAAFQYLFHARKVYDGPVVKIQTD